MRSLFPRPHPQGEGSGHFQVIFLGFRFEKSDYESDLEKHACDRHMGKLL